MSCDFWRQIPALIYKQHVVLKTFPYPEFHYQLQNCVFHFSVDVMLIYDWCGHIWCYMVSGNHGNSMWSLELEGVF